MGKVKEPIWLIFREAITRKLQRVKFNAPLPTRKKITLYFEKNLLIINHTKKCKNILQYSVMSMEGEKCVNVLHSFIPYEYIFATNE